MNLSIKIKNVEPLENFILSVTFTNGIEKIYDLKNLFEKLPQMFKPIQDNPSLFKNVCVDSGGIGISWNENIDISEYELWENGILK